MINKREEARKKVAMIYKDSIDKNTTNFIDLVSQIFYDLSYIGRYKFKNSEEEEYYYSISNDLEKKIEFFNKNTPWDSILFMPKKTEDIGKQSPLRIIEGMLEESYGITKEMITLKRFGWNNKKIERNAQYLSEDIEYCFFNFSQIEAYYAELCVYYTIIGFYEWVYAEPISQSITISSHNPKIKPQPQNDGNFPESNILPLMALILSAVICLVIYILTSI